MMNLTDYCRAAIKEQRVELVPEECSNGAWILHPYEVVDGKRVRRDDVRIIINRYGGTPTYTMIQPDCEKADTSAIERLCEHDYDEYRIAQLEAQMDAIRAKK